MVFAGINMVSLDFLARLDEVRASTASALAKSLTLKFFM